MTTLCRCDRCGKQSTNDMTYIKFMCIDGEHQPRFENFFRKLLKQDLKTKYHFRTLDVCWECMYEFNGWWSKDEK